MINRLLTFTLFSLMTALFAGAVAAQEYDPYGAPYSNKYYRQTPRQINLSIVRKPYLPEGQFALRMAVPDVVTGCPKLSNLSYEAEFIDKAINITIDDYIVDMRDAPPNPHYECPTNYQIPQAEIVLNRDELLEKGIKQIRFLADLPNENFDIELSENKIQLIPSELNRLHKALKIPRIENTLTHWFYPEGTIILYLPGATSDNRNLEESLKTLAGKHKLVPLESVLPDFKNPVSTPYNYYYVDETGKTAAEIAETDGGYLDKMLVDTISYELEGNVLAIRELAVYAKKPGMYE